MYFMNCPFKTEMGGRGEGLVVVGLGMRPGCLAACSERLLTSLSQADITDRSLWAPDAQLPRAMI